MTEHASITSGDERWPRIAVGFILASLAAGYTLALAFLWPALLAGLHTIVWYFLIGSLAFVWIGLLAALPAVYLISLAEARGWRSAAYYAVGGAGVALLWLGILMLFVPAPRLSADAAWELVLLASTPGLVGGLVYWWIVGRTAGASRRPLA